MIMIESEEITEEVTTWRVDVVATIARELGLSEGDVRGRRPGGVRLVCQELRPGGQPVRRHSQIVQLERLRRGICGTKRLGAVRDLQWLRRERKAVVTRAGAGRSVSEPSEPGPSPSVLPHPGWRGPVSARGESPRRSDRPRRRRSERADNPNGVPVALDHRFGDSGMRGLVTLAAEPAERRVDDRCLGMGVGSRPGVAILLEQA
jgi:hypothetical protein